MTISVPGREVVKKAVMLMIVVGCMLFSGAAFAEDFTVDGYRIMVYSPDVFRSTVKVSGRVEGGPRCKKLKLEMFLHDEQSRIAHIVTTIDDAGGSHLYEARDNVLKAGSKWTVSSIYTRCLNN